jgi:hypothetical protein
MAFFSVAAVGAVSLLVSYVALLLATGSAAVYTTAQFVVTQRQLEGQRYRPRPVTHRSHAD